jgi:hypothetical protein
MNSEFEVIIPPELENFGKLLTDVVFEACGDAAELFREEVRRNIETTSRYPDRQSSDEVLERLQLAVKSYVNRKPDGLEVDVVWEHEAAYWWEFGRKPGPVSPYIILDWMLSHHIVPTEGNTAEDYKRASFAIANKITKKGWVGLHPFMDAQAVAVPMMENFIAQQIEDFARRQLE